MLILWLEVVQLYYLLTDDLAENGYNTHAAGAYSLTNRQCVLGWLTNDTIRHIWDNDPRPSFGSSI
jgi:hypothetical protein